VRKDNLLHLKKKSKKLKNQIKKVLQIKLQLVVKLMILQKENNQKSQFLKIQPMLKILKSSNNNKSYNNKTLSQISQSHCKNWKKIAQTRSRINSRVLSIKRRRTL
jgi:hypothetical protein